MGYEHNITVRSLRRVKDGKTHHSFQMDGGKVVMVDDVQVNDNKLVVEFDLSFASFVHVNAHEPLSGDLVQTVTVE